MELTDNNAYNGNLYDSTTFVALTCWWSYFEIAGNHLQMGT